VQVGAEFQVRGPALSTYTAPLCGPPGAADSGSGGSLFAGGGGLVPPTDPSKRAEWHAAAETAAAARALLGLSEAQAAVSTFMIG
jgi:hypothetical protein